MRPAYAAPSLLWAAPQSGIRHGSSGCTPKATRSRRTVTAMLGLQRLIRFLFGPTCGARSTWLPILSAYDHRDIVRHTSVLEGPRCGLMKFSRRRDCITRQVCSLFPDGTTVSAITRRSEE